MLSLSFQILLFCASDWTKFCQTGAHRLRQWDRIFKDFSFPSSLRLRGLFVWCWKWTINNSVMTKKGSWAVVVIQAQQISDRLPWPFVHIRSCTQRITLIASGLSLEFLLVTFSLLKHLYPQDGWGSCFCISSGYLFPSSCALLLKCVVRVC